MAASGGVHPKLYTTLAHPSITHLAFYFFGLLLLAETRLGQSGRQIGDCEGGKTNLG